jgi:hypothetical protein
MTADEARSMIPNKVSELHLIEDEIKKRATKNYRFIVLKSMMDSDKDELIKNGFSVRKDEVGNHIITW